MGSLSGYNPGESLLHGGEAPINPVMGGGGLIEGDPDQSLLQGGNSANIVPLKGGTRSRKSKATTFTMKATVVQTLPPAVSNVLKGGGIGDPIDLQFKPLTSAKVDLPNLTSELPGLQKDYITKCMAEWMRRATTDNTVKETSKIMTVDKCVKLTDDDEKGQPGFDRYAQVIPKSTEIIYLFPSVNGDPKILQSCLTYIKDRKLDEDSKIVIIFAPRFFKVSSYDNSNLLANFLKLKSTAKAQVYMLVHNTDANKSVGCNLQGYGEKTVGLPVINMLEPSYIVYPFARTIEDELKGGILFSGAAANEPDIPASNIKSVSSLSNYILTGGRTGIAFPPNIKRNDDALGKITPYKIFRFLGEKAFSIPADQVYRFILQAEVDEEELIRAEESDTFPSTEEDKMYLDDVNYSRVPLAGRTFSIRVPINPVRNDWIHLQFTIDEAAMLNSLNLRPSILKAIFGEEWQSKLVEFMTNMINSKCFIDNTLLTNAECDVSSDFVDKVAQYIMENDDRLMQLQVEADDARDRYVEGLTYRLSAKKKSAADAAAEARARLLEEIDMLKRQAEFMGIDPSITPEALLKDPYADKRLEQIDKGDIEIIRQISQDIDTELWSRQILTTKLRTKEVIIGNISVAAATQDEAINKLHTEFLQLRKDYPGWTFNYSQSVTK